VTTRGGLKGRGVVVEQRTSASNTAHVTTRGGLRGRGVVVEVIASQLIKVLVVVQLNE